MTELSATTGDEGFVPRRPATGDALLSSSGQMAAQMFLERSRYYLLGEYLPKLRHCVAALPNELVWHRANSRSLRLHAAGPRGRITMVRQALLYLLENTCI